MGTKVYDAGTGRPGVYLFVHNMKENPGSMTLLVINTNKDPVSIHIPAEAEQYTLTSKELQGKTVMLNGKELQLGANDELPPITGDALKAGDARLPAISISFITFASPGNSNEK